MKKIVFAFLTCCSLVLLYSFTNQNFISSVAEPEVEIHYYEESEFLIVLEETISSMSENEKQQKILVKKSEDGMYGISNPITSTDDVERCGNCGPQLPEPWQVMAQLDNEPCWWLIDFTNHVWGWDGC